MPYSLKGNSVVKSDSGEVVKTHPTREKALAHLRALKANVEESSPAVLGALLEGFDEAKHPRGWHGRWIGGELHVFHGESKVTTVSASGSTSRERLLSAVQGAVRARPGRPGIDRVEAQRVVDLAAGTPPRRSEEYRGLGAIEPRSLPTSRRATLGKSEGDAVARTRAEILAKSPGAAADLARHQSIASGARDRAFDPVTMLGREGTAARERGASSLTSEHADTRDKLTNLPVGQRYGLHGPQGQVGRVERTSKGWEVYGPRDATPRVHKTPSSAAGHAMKIQRSAAQSRGAADRAKRGYAGEQEVRGMNARQSQRAEAEAERQLEIKARTASSSRERALAQTELDRRRGTRTARPRVREAAPEVLGALLGAI